jgi:hypothetical protein
MLNATHTSYHKGAYYGKIKLFSTLPFNIKSLYHDINLFKLAMEDYLSSRSYSVQFTSI